MGGEHAGTAMEIGNRVRLCRPLAKQKTITCTGRGKKLNWLKREGHVVSTGKRDNATTKGVVGVKWDDSKWTDYWPTRALELIT